MGGRRVKAFEPHKLWWTAEEIADESLPDMPDTKRGVQKLAKRQNWSTREGCVRRRSGRGGGYEYHFSLFSARAKDHLATRALECADDEDERRRSELWAGFEALPQKAKDKAQARAEAVRAALEFERLGQKRSYAVERAARAHEVGARSLWNWLKSVERADPGDFAPLLAGKHREAARVVATAECDEAAWDAFVKDYLRLSAPGFTACYLRTKNIATKNGWALPTEATLRRMVKKRIPRDVLILSRDGVAALKRMIPPQIRDKSHLHAMFALDADFHKFDVFVEWEEGRVIRPQLCAFHDIYSGRILGWRVAETPNAVTVMLTIGDVVEDYGIPAHVYLDNGREFASKWVTGGAANRFRFKIKDDDPLGVLPQIGAEVHFVNPYSGQSKPIERSFRDMCEEIAKDPRLKGAYTGNRPDAKPEDYGTRAVSRELFMEVLAEGISIMNARTGRRAATCKGRSYDETFAASYATAPIRKATAEQRRVWLLGAQTLKAHKESGELAFQGNKYWSPWMAEFAAQKLVARFDPEDLHGGLHVYGLDGAYLGFAECRLAVGFNDMEAAKDIARKRSQLLRATRERQKALIRLQDAEHDALVREAAPAGEVIDLAAKVVEGRFDAKRRADAAAERPAAPEAAPMSAKVAEIYRLQVERFEASAQGGASEAEGVKQDSARDRFHWCRSVFKRAEAGEEIGEAELAKARSYRQSNEYAAEERMEKFRAQFDAATEG